VASGTAALRAGYHVFSQVASMAPMRTGTFPRIPYDWRPPSILRLKERLWKPKDRRLFTPHVFGWGWSINLYELLRRLGVVRRPAC
jgi:hypothetical protein